MYELYFNKAIVGQIAEPCNWEQNDTKLCEEEDGIGYGLPVKRGTDKERQVLLWADAIDVPVLGISRLVQTNTNDLYSSNSLYRKNDSVSVLTKGRINVTTAENVIAGEKAYVTANTGLFTNVAQDNLEIGKFLTTGTGVVILEINL